MAEPVSLADLKTHLRLDLNDTSEDGYLTGRVVAARRACEYRIDRSIVGATEILTLDAFPGIAHDLFPVIPLEARSSRARDIILAGGAVASISSVAYIDAAGAPQILDPTAYVADLADEPAVLAPVGTWPATADRPGAVTITYLVSPLGADDLAAVGEAMMLLIGHWYRNRESVAVDVRGTPIELPNSVSWLLDPLRQWATE